MPWSTVAPAIAAELGKVHEVGRVYVGDLHLRDLERIQSLFAYPQPGAPDMVRGWRIVRDQVAEAHFSCGGDNRTRAYERYTLRGISARTDDVGEETDFQELVDRVFDMFRPLSMTQLGGAILISGSTSPILDRVAFGDFGVYYAEMALDVEEAYAVGTPASGHPAHKASRSGPDDEGAIALQLAGYLAAVDGCGQVHHERPMTVDGADVIARYATTDAEGRQQLAVWLVWRLAVSEERQTDGLLSRSETWKLSNYRSWCDALGTYDAHQRHLDDVRAVFRGLGNLGNTVNPTMVFSSPLQIRAVSASGGVLCHRADCEVTITQIIYGG